jgi:hypothetical protein
LALPRTRALTLSLTLAEARSEELGEWIVTLTFTFRLSGLFLYVRGHCNIDHRRSNPRCHSFGRPVEREQRIDACVVDRRGWGIERGGSVNVLVSKDKSSGEENQCESHEGSNETLSLSS